MATLRTPNDGQSRTELFEVLYDDLRALAARKLRAERVGHTLQPTALVHELWIELEGQDRARWNGESHFKAIAAKLMSRLLAEHARKKKAKKRGGSWQRVTLDGELAITQAGEESVAALNKAMEKLGKCDPQLATIVWCYFVGLKQREIGEELNISERKVRQDWAFAKAWLADELSRELNG